MDLEDYLTLIIKYLSPHLVSRQLRKKNVDKLYLNIFDSIILEQSDVGINRSIGEITYRLKTNNSSTTLEVFFAGKDSPSTYLFPETFNLSLIRVLSLKWRISIVNERLKNVEGMIWSR
jgi:hypothetical protein